jgi:Acetyltransferase (GNAT) domain
MDRLRLVRRARAVRMIEGFDGIAALPMDAVALFAEREDFQLGATWFETVAAHALPDGGCPLLLLYREAGQPVALLPLQRAADGKLSGLACPYTCAFRPLVAEGADAATLRRAGLAFGRACRAAGPLRLDALDPDWPGLMPLLGGFARAGMLSLRFAHFGNWHADVGGQDWPAYLAARPGELRETIRRRLARALRDPDIRFDLITDGHGLAAGLAAYEQVYAKSWKAPEPFLAFGPAYLRAAAAAGVLRLGVLRHSGTPVAAQYWCVTNGTARVEKLAHDEAARALSPGTVLTALMVRHLLDRDRVAELDFGRGDDAYKTGWTGQRRQRIGVLLCPPWHPAGAAALVRHATGRVRKALARNR